MCMGAIPAAGMLGGKGILPYALGGLTGLAIDKLGSKKKSATPATGGA